MAHQILVAGGLERFYDLAGNKVVAPAADGATLDTAWLLALEADQTGDVRQLRMDVQGIHCAACVWVIERIFDRQPGTCSLVINPGRGTLNAEVTQDFDAIAFVNALSPLGYRCGPLGKRRDVETDGLGMRFGVCAALALNSMTLSLSGYFGLSEATEPDLHHLFGWVNAGLGALSVAIGAPVFARRAWGALRQRALHLDLPIAIAIILGGLGSLWLAVTKGHDAAFFDTLSIFVALMLLGRFLQQRMVARNRRLLLEGEDLADGRVRVVDPTTGRLQWTRYDAITPGERLVVACGELLPVEAEATTPAEVSLAWFTGESEPVLFAPGTRIPAGAHLLSQQTVEFTATASFESSALSALLAPKGSDVHQSGFWGVVSTTYVVTVLALAALGAVAWSHAGASASLEVAIALLVVTCPCALGIATPLAYELAYARLSQRGLRATTSDLLDRVLAIKFVLFDKTGTVTLGALRLEAPDALEGLPPATRAALHQMVIRSNHPKSRALSVALERYDLRYDPTFSVAELPGVGLRLTQSGVVWRLDAQGPVDALGRQPLTLWRDDVPVQRFSFVEQVRPETRQEFAVLRALGIEPWLITGDTAEHAERVADSLGLAMTHVRASQRPADKRRLCDALGRAHVLAVGDGLNDAEMLDTAAVAGAVVNGAPAMTARADFFVTSNAVASVSSLIQMARRVRQVVARNLVFAVAYNVVGVTLAMMGLLTPLLCAILMPASALVVIAMTAASLGRRSPRRHTRSPITPMWAEVRS